MAGKDHEHFWKCTQSDPDKSALDFVTYALGVSTDKKHPNPAQLFPALIAEHETMVCLQMFAQRILNHVKQLSKTGAPSSSTLPVTATTTIVAPITTPPTTSLPRTTNTNGMQCCPVEQLSPRTGRVLRTFSNDLGPLDSNANRGVVRNSFSRHRNPGDPLRDVPLEVGDITNFATATAAVAPITTAPTTSPPRTTITKGMHCCPVEQLSPRTGRILRTFSNGLEVQNEFFKSAHPRGFWKAVTGKNRVRLGLVLKVLLSLVS
jgi:hypothetical protein